MYADELLVPWFRRVLRVLAAIRPFDSHTHLGGNDPEGWQCTSAELTAALELVDGRAAVSR